MKMNEHPVRIGTEAIAGNTGIMTEEAGIVIGVTETVVVTMKETGSVPAVMIQEVVAGLVHGLKNAPETMDVIMIVIGNFNSSNVCIWVFLAFA